jgi:hypothetical protein
MNKSVHRVRCAGYSTEYNCRNNALAGEHHCSFCKGRQFELEVCKVIRDLGGKANHNIKVDGSQCDIAAEFEQNLGPVTYYIECKAEAEPVGVNDVIHFQNTFATASALRRFDKPLMVSRSGFTADAKTKAQALGVMCSTLEELRDRRADFHPYLKAVVDEYEESAFYKTKHYLALTASASPPSDTSTPAGSRLLEEHLEDFRANIVKGPLLLIMGDFGCGKTTTLRRFFWKEARSCLAGNKTCRIPIFVNLRDFHLTMDLNKTLVGMLLDEYGLKMEGLRVFRELNREGKLIILLDGFDEMVAKIGPEYLLPAFQQFEKVVHDQSKVVITVRSHFLRSATELNKIADTSALQQYAREHGYALLHINRLVPDQIEEYIRRIAPAGIEFLQSHPRLNQLATRPILLDMIVETLPKLLALGRTPFASDLYYMYTDQWLDRDDWRCKMDHKSRRFFSQQLAYFFLKTKNLSIHYSLLPPIIQKQFPEVKQYRVLEYFDVDVRTSTFLTRDPTGKYSFSHKSFYEYFVASKVVDDVLANEQVSKDDHFSPEIIEFIEDIIRSRFTELSTDNCERLLVSLVRIYSNSSDAIAEFQAIPSEKRDRDVVVEAIARDALLKVAHFANEIVPAGSVFVIFEYTARKFLGRVEWASSANVWRQRPMTKMEGTINRFLHCALIPQQKCEYKFLEDGAWEPRENRILDLRNTKALLQTDEHFGDVW